MGPVVKGYHGETSTRSSEFDSPRVHIDTAFDNSVNRSIMEDKLTSHRMPSGSEPMTAPQGRFLVSVISLVLYFIYG